MAEMRIRQTGSIIPVANQWKYSTYCNGTVWSTYTGVYSGYSTGETQVMTDWVEKDFHKRKAAGEIMNHPLHSVKTAQVGYNNSQYAIVYTPACSGTTHKRQDGTDIRSFSTNFNSFGMPYDFKAVIETLEDTVSTQVLAGVEEPTWNLALFAAELDKTAKMFRPSIVRGLKTLERAQRDYRRWKRREGVPMARIRLFNRTLNGFARFVSDNWLKYRFGLLPLVYDWEDFQKVVNEPELSPRLTSRAKAEYSWPKMESSKVTNDGYFSGTTSYSRTVNATVRGGLLYEHDMVLSDRLGYNLQSVIPTAYELIPFSFVVDRFFQIQDFLQAMQPKSGVKELARWIKTTVVTEDTYDVYATGMTRTNYSNTGSISFGSSRKITDVIRLPMLKAPSVVPVWRLIDMREAKHVRHLADYVALAAQLFLR